jgi:YD repeat-containing protein
VGSVNNPLEYHPIWRTTLVYDGFDRLSRTRYPEVSGSGSSTTDYEELTYDAASNVVSERRRSGAVFTASYDNLNRLTTLTTPSGMENLAYTYDNLGRRLTQSFAGGQTLSFTWDALSRDLSQSSPLGTVGFQYDLAGRRTRITWPDNVYAQYDYSLYGEVTAIRENGASSGAGVLGAYTYDNLGRLTGVSRGNGVGSTMAWDGASRMTALSHDAAGSAHDLSIDMAHSPASQVTSRTPVGLSRSHPHPHRRGTPRPCP